MGTSEQQLLSVIEKPGLASGPQAGWGAGGLRRLFDGLPGHVRALGERLRSEAMRLSTLNLVLAGANIVVAVYLMFSIMSALRESRRAFDQSGNPRFAAAGKIRKPDFPLKELEFYHARVGDRDIFRIGGKLIRSNGEEPAEGGTVITDAVRDLRLVGIAWSDNPDVMIEDASKGVTYFLHPGETMENGIRVKEVTREKVILEYQQETIDLK